MKETRLINRFSEKILVWGNGPFWAQKIVHPHNSGSTGRIFSRFYTMKISMRVISIIFKKKIVCAKWTILGPKMVHPHNSGSAVRIFLNVAQ